MPLNDSDDLRDLVTSMFPGPQLVIEGPAKASGQRVVYFCHFEGEADQEPIDPRLPDAVGWGPVVVKVSESGSPNAMAYLRKEVEILGAINSDAYPTLYYDKVYRHDPRDGSSLDRFLFITIEQRVDAQPLSALMDSYRDPSDVRHFLLNAIKALRIMWEHPARLIHRDLKPDNILIREDGSVVIIDLGIVREEGVDGLTNSFVPYGPCSILYASPEQAMNQKRKISYRSDCFSLGIIAYELTAGRNPFGAVGDHFGEVIDRICNHRQDPLREVTGSDVMYSELIDRMLSKQPFQRHRRIADLVSDLERLFV
ncbi:serine/threonine protein kinase [Haloferula sargassicola]|uniref:Serine/threonine-protein kinase PknD n=1 Tax=Haloferula sargassicola TaxID=490096 RepID=A0ABP9UMF2_9BACT